MTTETNACPHLPRHAREPRIGLRADGLRVLLYTCGVCGQRDVVDTADASDGLADVDERHGGPRGAGNGSSVRMDSTIGGR